MKNLCAATLALVLVMGAPRPPRSPTSAWASALRSPRASSTTAPMPPLRVSSNGVPSTESYDSTLGGQFTVSFPVDERLALRLDIYGQSTTGTDSAPGFQSYNLQHDLFSLGGEAQYFPGTGDAYRHRGAYLVGGLSMDLERFRSSYGDTNWTGYNVNKTRLGGLAGVGYSFRPYGRWRTNAEVAFHKTLSAYDTNAQPTVGNPATPPADFVRLTYGVVF